MSDKREFSTAFQAVCDISQLGLSVVAPIVLCAFLGNWLQKKYSLPDYVTLIAVLLGVAAGINGFVRFVQNYLKRLERHDKTPKQ